ncbi:MAG: carboxypeptidase regulatory-like domain-containing protein [Planctomycetia bacterium]|nr:carboxypeptidase regulatory-like domain-containing protein [Planctomycetia bacterium]
MRKRAALIAVLAAVALAEAVAIFGPTAGEDPSDERAGPRPAARSPDGGPADRTSASSPPLAGAGHAEAPAPTAADRLVVHVSASFGGPIEGAELTLATDDGMPRTATSDANGLATFSPRPVGPTRLTVRAKGYVAYDGSDPVRETVRGEVFVSLRRLVSLAGRVVDATTGQPIAAAAVEALEAGQFMISPAGRQRIDRSLGAATSDATGRFRIDDVEETWTWSGIRTLRVDARGYRTRWHVPRQSTPDDGIDIAMVPGGSIQGRVVGADERPVPGATVFACLDARSVDPVAEADGFAPPSAYLLRGLTPPEAAFGTDAFATLSTTTDDVGRYRIDGVGLGEAYAVAAFRSGTGRSPVVRGVRTTRTDAAATTDLRLDAGVRLTVHCADARGVPWPGLKIQLRDAEGHRRVVDTTTTDARGTAAFLGLLPGRVTIRVPDPVHGDVAGPTVVIAETDVVSGWTLAGVPGAPKDAPLTKPAEFLPPVRSDDDPPPPPTWRLHLALEPGGPAPSQVRVTTDSPASRSWWTVTWTPDTDGRMAIESRQVGRVQLRVEADGRVPFEKEFDAVADRTTDLGTELLERGLALQGRLLGPSDRPVVGLEVTASYDDAARTRREFHGCGSVASDAEGRFTFRGLTAGTIRLTSLDPRFLPLRTTVDVPKLELHDVHVDPGTVLRVLVVDADGLPRARCGVAVRFPADDDGDDVEASGETGVDGVVEARVRPGTVRIEVNQDVGYGGPDDVHLTATVPTADGGPIRVTLPRR